MRIEEEITALPNSGYRIETRLYLDGETDEQLREMYALLDRRETEQRSRIWTKGEHGCFTGSVSTGGGTASGSAGNGVDKSEYCGIINARRLLYLSKCLGHTFAFAHSVRIGKLYHVLRTWYNRSRK